MNNGKANPRTLRLSRLGAFLRHSHSFVLLIGALCSFIPERVVVETVVGVVTDAEISRVTDNSADQFLVTVEKADGSTEVFEVDDAFWWLKFDATDRYFALKQGGQFKLTVTGWRIPFLSTFRNIVEFEEVNPPQ